MGLVLDYVQEPKGNRQSYRYRRRVPFELKPYIGESELIASLGKSYSVAVKTYPSVHTAFERKLEAARKTYRRDQAKLPDSANPTKLERYHELLGELKALGFDYPLAGTDDEDDQEVIRRQVMADQIASKYPEDPETGDRDINNPDD